MPSKIITNGRLEYLEATIDVIYPDIGKVTYRGSRPIIVSNQWAPPVKMPVKGDLIMLDGKQYRVLKINDTVAEVQAMYNTWYKTDITYTTEAFGKTQTYENSYLDRRCDTLFYNDLSTIMQNAIVTKTFQQDLWYWNSGTSGGSGNPIYQGTYGTSNYCLGLSSATFGSSISRKCYVLSVQDVIDYLGVTTDMTASNTTLTSENVWKMFWNQPTSPSNFYCWLRSARADKSGNAFCIYINDGYLNTYNVSNQCSVRPAFQIDLNKIEWTKA